MTAPRAPRSPETVVAEGPAHWSPSSARWRRWAYLGARYGPRFFVRLSPPLIGLGFGLALPGARARVLDNLRRIHGQRDPLVEAWDVARTFGNFAACLAESLGAGRREGRDARYRVRGVERFHALRAQGRGVILATAHVGPWDAAARALGQGPDERVMLVMGGELDARAQAFHDLVREREGLHVVRVGRHPLDALPLLSWLQAGNVAAVQMDRAPKGMESIDSELFGGAFTVPRGPFALSALLEVPVLPVFASREGHFDYRVDVGFPVVVAKGADADEERRAARFVTAQMETFLRAHATEWFHFDAEPGAGGSAL